VDLVGWDVHKAIVDNVYANCKDEAHDSFKMPSFMGGRSRKEASATRLRSSAVSTGELARKLLSSIQNRWTSGVSIAGADRIRRKMKWLHRVGRYADALEVLANASGSDAELCRRVVLGYVSYALNRVGEVAASAADVDSIMSYGFKLAPPTAIVDLLGAKNTVCDAGKTELPVPATVEQAAAGGAKMFDGGVLKYGRTFVWINLCWINLDR